VSLLVTYGYVPKNNESIRPWVPSRRTFLLASMAVFASSVTSVKYGASSGMSLAIFPVRRTRSSCAGPTPQPVVPKPLRCALDLSVVECFSSIIEHCGSMPMRFLTFVSSISLSNCGT